MSRALRVVATALILTAGAACGSGESSGTSAPSSSSSPPAAAQFGTPECDTYMSKYLACIDRMPEAARAAARQSLDQTRAAWQQAAATDQGRAALAMTCKAASDAAGPSMQAYGCSW